MCATVPPNTPWVTPVAKSPEKDMFVVHAEAKITTSMIVPLPTNALVAAAEERGDILLENLLVRRSPLSRA